MNTNINYQPESDELSDELIEGYYFCPSCDKKTYHSLSANLSNMHYHSMSLEDIEEAEKNSILRCDECMYKAEKEYYEG